MNDRQTYGRECGKSQLQKRLLGKALDEGKRVFVVGLELSTIQRRRGRLTLIKRVDGGQSDE